jgi:hypothetical protein
MPFNLSSRRKWLVSFMVGQICCSEKRTQYLFERSLFRTQMDVIVLVGKKTPCFFVEPKPSIFGLAARNLSS